MNAVQCIEHSRSSSQAHDYSVELLFHSNANFLVFIGSIEQIFKTNIPKMSGVNGCRKLNVVILYSLKPRQAHIIKKCVILNQKETDLGKLVMSWLY